MNDAALIQSIRSGDPEGPYNLHKVYASELTSVCGYYFPDRNDAESAMADGFVKFLTIMTSPDPPDIKSLIAYLRRVMHNECRMILARTRQSTRPWIEADEADIEAGPPDDLLQKLYLDDILRVINRLPERYRAVFMLF